MRVVQAEFPNPGRDDDAHEGGETLRRQYAGATPGAPWYARATDNHADDTAASAAAPIPNRQQQHRRQQFGNTQQQAESIRPESSDQGNDAVTAETRPGSGCLVR